MICDQIQIDAKVHYMNSQIWEVYVASALGLRLTLNLTPRQHLLRVAAAITIKDRWNKKGSTNPPDCV